MERLLFEFIGRSTLIAASAAAVLVLFRLRSAAVQHRLWTGVLLTMLALPFWISQGPKAALRLLPPGHSRRSRSSPRLP